MNSKKQKLIIEYLVSSPDLFALCTGIVKAKYFNPEYRSAVAFMQEYYNDHNAIPDVYQVEAETGVDLSPKSITRDQFAYCCKEVETFCKQSAIKQALLVCPELAEKEEYGKIEKIMTDAVTVAITSNLGVDFFVDTRESLARVLATGTTISTGWKEVDAVLFGGIQKKQLILFSAGSGGGKSITMQNLGINLVAQGLNVLYISLELSEDLLSERMAVLLTGVGKMQMRENLEDVLFGISEFASQNQPGKMMFKQMPAGSTCNDIKAYLKEYELRYGHLPDAVITDYMDLMSPIDKVSADNVFEKDKRVAEELRNLGVEYNLISITASQLNRSSVGVEAINHSHIAGGISKINTADTYITIILSETLKAAGEIALHYQKTRTSDGVGKTTYLAFNKSSLRMTNKPENKSSIVAAPIGDAIQQRGKSKLASMFEKNDDTYE